MGEEGKQEYHDAMQEIKARWLEYRHLGTKLIDVPESDTELDPWGGIPIDSLADGGPKPKVLELFTQSLSLQRNRRQRALRPQGVDTLVGVHMLPDNVCQQASVDVWIGGVPVSQLTFSTGDKRLVIEDATCCHTLPLFYHKVEFVLRSGVAATFSLVYCGLPMYARRYIVLTPHCYLVPLHLRTRHTLEKSIFVIGGGGGNVIEGDDREVASRVAKGHSVLLDIWEGHCPPGQCLQRLAAVKEELMAAAWHPKRMVEWCWDDEDRRELEDL